jgi:glycosyltransferase involved in cell wall biosynthesis
MPVIAFGQGGACETVVAPDTVSSPSRAGTGWFFGEQTTDALARAIIEFEDQPERFNAAAARRQAERFGARRFERELTAYIEQVAAERHSLTHAA